MYRVSSGIHLHRYGLNGDVNVGFFKKICHWLPLISKPGWIPCLCVLSPARNGFLRFTSGVTPADVLMASMAASHIPYMNVAEVGYWDSETSRAVSRHAIHSAAVTSYYIIFYSFWRNGSSLSWIWAASRSLFVIWCSVMHPKDIWILCDIFKSTNVTMDSECCYIDYSSNRICRGCLSLADLTCGSADAQKQQIHEDFTLTNACTHVQVCT